MKKHILFLLCYTQFMMFTNDGNKVADFLCKKEIVTEELLFHENLKDLKKDSVEITDYKTEIACGVCSFIAAMLLPLPFIYIDGLIRKTTSKKS